MVPTCSLSPPFAALWAAHLYQNESWVPPGKVHWSAFSLSRWANCCFHLLMYHFTYVKTDRKQIPAPRENYHVPDPTRFLDPGLDPRGRGVTSSHTKVLHTHIHPPLKWTLNGLVHTTKFAPLNDVIMW